MPYTLYKRVHHEDDDNPDGKKYRLFSSGNLREIWETVKIYLEDGIWKRNVAKYLCTSRSLKSGDRYVILDPNDSYYIGQIVAPGVLDEYICLGWFEGDDWMETEQ